ncbi:MAG TPA: ankyrin repeat domain-containing protein, partial [Rhodanobacteraceae bacterium]
NVQLALVLRTLRKPGQFLLCGDSNQIVHPNFFAWSAVKSLFWRDPSLAQQQSLSVLTVNYRNARTVTQLANALLKVKHARFGSVDRESNHLVDAVRAQEGEVRLLPDTETARHEIDARTRGSTRCAVLVLRDEDKAAARAAFHTPLVFSVHEAKGLEYPTIVLYGLVSGHRQAYAEVCAGVTPADLAVDSLAYRRAKDKQDKSLEIWKFYVNALYVAITRAVERVWLIERDTAHPLLGLLGLRDGETALGAVEPASSREDWEREARRLELQGKQEQAAAIRETVLHTAKVPWTVWNEATLAPALARALNPADVSNKLRQQVLDFALWHRQERYVMQLAEAARWGPAIDLIRNAHAGRLAQAVASVATRHLAAWTKKAFKNVLEQCDQYGVEHRDVFDATPLMRAAQAGNVPLVDALLARGADVEARDLFGQTPILFALERAALDADYARGPFGDVYTRVAPPALDVETEGRLVRLYPHQGEYFVLLTMLAGIKTLGSQLVPPDTCPLWQRLGFNTSWLMRNVESLPISVLKAERHKRAWFNAVLARAEVASSYVPARRLWLRLQRGHYIPNPTLRLRVHAADGQEAWQPVTEVMAVRRVLAGNGYGATAAALAELLPATESGRGPA